MPTFKLDGREIPFEPGDTILRAAHRSGIDIPHYCWHPGLSVAANCRMCLVEIGPPPGRPPLLLNVLRWDAERQAYVDERKPKLQPACQMPVAEGMDVKSESSEHAQRARRAVQELLLLNHPVDCPICDQAGECRLQDYWLEHQASKKRMRDEPVHKPKAVPFSDTIVYDAERCIVCTRCIRVCNELAKDPVLSLRERGNLNEVVLAPGRQLNHPYSLMTEYVCPVGALTAQDFRFKARVWFLRSARTVCQGCATGCNAFLDFDPRTQTVYRHRPRENQAVNKYWMCDEGMLSYARVHEGRVLKSSVKGKPKSASTALGAVAKRLLKAEEGGKLGVLLSAQHSQEDNFAVLELGKRLGATRFFVSGRAPGEGDDVLRHVDKNPNTAGVQQLCPEAGSVEQLANELQTGAFSDLLILGGELPDDAMARAFDRASVRVVLATHEGALAERATVLLPVSTWAESDGTFVNASGMAQVSQRAIRPLGDSLPAWKLATQLAAALGLEGFGWKKVRDVQRAMSPGDGPEDDSGARMGAAEAGAAG
jgi:NADH-quinone oxidoreductase subunit G